MEKIDNIIDQAISEVQAVEASSMKDLAPLYKKRDALVAKIQPLEAELREINHQIREAEAPLREARRQHAGLARAKATTRSLKAVESK